MINTIDQNGVTWSKSGRSSGRNACVEIAVVGGTENR